MTEQPRGRRSWKWPLLCIAAGFVALEAVLRLIGLTTPVLYDSDPAAGYRIEPRQEARFLTNNIHIDQWGLRSLREKKPAGPNTNVILVLGDSVTWGGVQLRQNELFTSLVEEQLADALVLNAGVNAYSVSQMTALFKHMKPLKPDCVVVYVIPTDFYRPPAVRLESGSPVFPLEPPSLAMPVFGALVVRWAAKATGWSWLQPETEIVDLAPDMTDMERRAANMKALVSLRDSLDGETSLVVVVSPVPAHPENAPLDSELVEMLDGHGFDWVNLGESIAPESGLFKDHIHLNAAGHKRVADALSEVLHARGF